MSGISCYCRICVHSNNPDFFVMTQTLGCNHFTLRLSIVGILSK